MNKLASHPAQLRGPAQASGTRTQSRYRCWLVRNTQSLGSSLPPRSAPPPSIAGTRAPPQAHNYLHTYVRTQYTYTQLQATPHMAAAGVLLPASPHTHVRVLAELDTTTDAARGGWQQSRGVSPVFHHHILLTHMCACVTLISPSEDTAL